MRFPKAKASRRTVLGTLAALAAGAAAPLRAGTAQAPAPDFTLPARAGGELSLADLKGNVVLINFWATWCGPCRQEMPYLEQIWQRYKGLGFTLLGVNVEEDSAGAVKWLEQTPVSFPVLFDRENRVSKLYDVTAMPSTVIVDRRGQVRFVHYGYTKGTESAYQDQVRTLIREKA
jgi:peroxiredoxin